MIDAGGPGAGCPALSLAGLIKQIGRMQRPGEVAAAAQPIGDMLDLGNGSPTTVTPCHCPAYQANSRPAERHHAADKGRAGHFLAGNSRTGTPVGPAARALGSDSTPRPLGHLLWAACLPFKSGHNTAVWPQLQPCGCNKPPGPLAQGTVASLDDKPQSASRSRSRPAAVWPRPHATRRVAPRTNLRPIS